MRKLPTKIGIIDSLQNTDSRMRFGDWEGYDPTLQRKYLAMKINELIDYLRAAPEIPNELPAQLKQEGSKVVHVHEWRLLQRMGTHGYFDCLVCGETLEKIIVGK